MQDVLTDITDARQFAPTCCAVTHDADLSRPIGSSPTVESHRLGFTACQPAPDAFDLFTQPCANRMIS